MNKTFYCTICDKKFDSDRKFLQHINMHTYDEISHILCMNNMQINIDYVRCAICGSVMLDLCQHLRYIEKINKTNYIITYPDNKIKAEVILDKFHETCMKKYNSTSPFSSPEIIKKIKATWENKYHTSNPASAPEIKKKINATNIKKYGVKYPLESTEIRNKCQNTCKQRYNVNNPFQAEHVKNKIAETNTKRYGVKHPLQAKMIINKIRKTCIEKYGVDWATKSAEVKEKAKANNIKKYGHAYIAKNKDVIDKIKHTKYERYGVYSNIAPSFSLNSQKLFKTLATELEKYNINDCFYATSSNKYTINNQKIFNCEYQVYIKHHLIRHLDFYIKTLNKWIEYDENYHKSIKQNKIDIDRENEIKNVIPGIMLLRISEDDYIANPDNVVKKCIEFILDKTMECDNNASSN